MHILIVDDVEETSLLFSYAFGLAGHTAQTASSGGEALALLTTQAYDAIVLDAHMPHMDGVEALQRIRALPNGQQVPIVVFTGDTSAALHRQLMAAGANTVVYKPMFPDVVLNCIEECRRTFPHSVDKSLY
ncbi:MAG: response regulator [Abitibacteriaceae bacterium]|nr:response regulator [Abditibacteriaceae bacterium]